MTRLLPLLALVLFVALAGSTPADAAGPAPVDLNTATVEELCTLPGVGPKKAEAILELRKKRRFTRVTQLLEVKGIGQKTLARLKPHVRVAPATPGTSQAAAPSPAAGGL